MQFKEDDFVRDIILKHLADSTETESQLSDEDEVEYCEDENEKTDDGIYEDETSENSKAVSDEKEPVIMFQNQ